MLRRLVGACGLQVRFDLEPQWADVDEQITDLLRWDPLVRLDEDGYAAVTTAALLIAGGARLVVAGHLAARMLGAPVADSVDRVWCRLADVDALLAAAHRIRFDARPIHPRYADDDDEEDRLVYADRDEIRIGRAVITLGKPPEPGWWHEIADVPVPVAGLGDVRTGQRWSGADRIGLERLAVMLDTDP
jgi:hypothetical protein